MRRRPPWLIVALYLTAILGGMVWALYVLLS